MSLTLVSHNTDMEECGISRFVGSILRITNTSSHTHEYTVNRLLTDLGELYRNGRLNTGEYHTIIGKGADVADFFHYDVDALPCENNSWYRASLIHQIGQGMLQALERIRPDITTLTFFAEAMSGLGMGRAGNSRTNPLTCRQWANDLPPYTG